MSSFLGDLLASTITDGAPGEAKSALAQGLNSGQLQALRLLGGDGNVFVTGGAGSGKSYLMNKFLRGVDSSLFPVLASTGAAAVLVGGRTFHSFFGLGILEGGVEATIERALKDRRLSRRLRKISGFVLDEVSMIPGHVLAAAEQIASLIRDDDRPWGGLKVIAVGDFAQLPPISKAVIPSASAAVWSQDDFAQVPPTLTSSGPKSKDWAFLNPVWAKSAFKSIHLIEMMRVKDDPEFCEILGDVRHGLVTERVRDLLNWRVKHQEDEDFEGTVLFARKVDVDRINFQKLKLLKGEPSYFETEYTGADRYQKILSAQAPVSPRLELKKGALVMCRLNDPKGRWVNGSLGHVTDIHSDEIELRLLGGNHVCIEKARFSMLDADGNEVATAKNFPLNLAYAITIHKAQGATLDRVTVSLRRLWEPGQAYVALSRVKHSEGLVIDSWDESSIFADPQVSAFHAAISRDQV